MGASVKFPGLYLPLDANDIKRNKGPHHGKSGVVDGVVYYKDPHYFAKPKYHSGVDYYCGVSPVYAISRGKILINKSIVSSNYYQKYVIIHHFIDFLGVSADIFGIYMHVQCNLSEGSSVQAGQKIGFVFDVNDKNAYNYSTSKNHEQHLHFGLNQYNLFDPKCPYYHDFITKSIGLGICKLDPDSRGFVDPVKFFNHPMKFIASEQLHLSF